MGRNALKALAALALALSLPAASLASARPAGPASTTTLPALAVEVVAEVNAVRRARGLRPLRASTGLTTAALRHTGAMAARGRFAHELPGGPSFSTRMRRHYRPGGPGWATGENLAWTAPGMTARAAVRMWLESPGHRRNVLGRRWREIGVGAVLVQRAPGDFGGSDVTLVTATFGVRG